MDKPLWNHQVYAIQRAQINPDLGLLFEQGTGKTRTLIEILRRQYAKAGSLRRTLILCPPIVCPNWKNEFKMFSKINPNDIVILAKSGKQRIATLAEKCYDKDLKALPKIIITNYESVQMEDLFKLIMLWQPEIMVCDESQRVKNPSAVRAKKVAELADLTKHNYILTGTPILDGKGMDAFMQFRILDRGLTFGKNFFSFRNQYFMDKNAGMNKNNYFPKWVPKPESYRQFQERIKAKGIRVEKKDCLDLPPLIRQTITVSLSAQQAKAYKEMYNEYITFIDSKANEPKAVVAQLAVTKSLRLQQIVSGFAKDENGEVHALDCPRLAALKELIEDIVVDGQKKVIIWCVFKENYRMISELCKILKLEHRFLVGDMSSEQREKAMKEFRTDPDVNVLIANPGAGGVGVNLIEASYSIYYSKGFKLEDDLQSEARNYRGGSEIHEKVTRIDLVANGTIDELINEALLSKHKVSEEILGWNERMKL